MLVNLTEIFPDIVAITLLLPISISYDSTMQFPSFDVTVVELYNAT